MPEDKFKPGGAYTQVTPEEMDARNNGGVTPPDVQQKLISHVMSPIDIGLDFTKKTLATAATIGNEAIAKSGEVLGNLASGATQLLKGNPLIYPMLGGSKGIDTISSGIKSGAKYLAENARTQGDSTVAKESFAPSIAKGVGNFAGSVAGQIPALAIGGAGLKALNLGTIPNFLVKSLGNTTIMTQGLEGRTPTAKEAGGYLALDVVLAGIVKGLSMAYQSAFTASPTQMKQSLRAYGTTPGANAEAAGLAGTSKQIMGQASDDVGTTWDKLMKLVKSDPEKITPEAFNGIKEGMAAEMTKNLPADSPRTKEVFKAVYDVVDNYTPTEPIAKEQIVGIITDINKELFQTGDKIVLSAKQSESLANIFKNELKDFLPEGSKQLYTRMAVMKGIQQTMESDIVKKAVLRTMLGGLGGFSLGYNSDMKSTANKVWNGIIGGLIGATVMNGITNNTFVKTVGAETGKVLFNPTVVKTAIQGVQDSYNK